MKLIRVSLSATTEGGEYLRWSSKRPRELAEQIVEMKKLVAPGVAIMLRKIFRGKRGREVVKEMPVY